MTRGETRTFSAWKGEVATTPEVVLAVLMFCHAHVRFRSLRDELSLNDKYADARQSCPAEFVGKTGKNSRVRSRADLDQSHQTREMDVIIESRQF